IKATDLTGYQAILSVSPSYNKPSQEGIYRHFKAVAEASPLPIILYNVPGRTGINMMPETVIRLAQDFDSIIGIKEAAGDIVQALSLIQKKPDNFLIISGDDMIALPMTLAGGAGVISVIAQGLPSDFSSMIRLGLKGEASKAYTIQYRLMDSIDLIFEEGNPTGIKELLRQQNYCSNKVRLPLVEATKTLQNRIQLFLKEYH
ncbi:MAG TPA: 4-hydroxy-tetrahydrodipicolinate synthase, partial [Saprospiraceae bacterium]|nr:4-hydroxy-tetrahydrodipicolinate synthase [Saprospiraceae bacterium]